MFFMLSVPSTSYSAIGYDLLEYFGVRNPLWVMVLCMHCMYLNTSRLIKIFQDGRIPNFATVVKFNTNRTSMLNSFVRKFRSLVLNGFRMRSAVLCSTKEISDTCLEALQSELTTEIRNIIDTRNMSFTDIIL